MSWFNSIIATNAKTLSKLSTTLGIGAGETWPGEVALKLNPDIFSSLAKGFAKGMIIVAGTNGKTTTALMIKTILEAQGLRVIHNASGANLLNGIVSSLINKTDWKGQIAVDWGVFEVDENSLPIVIKSIKSVKSKVIIVLLNLFRDQLDRYGEVDVIAEKWGRALREQHEQDQQREQHEQDQQDKKDSKARKTNSIQIIANADDPLIAHLASSSAGKFKTSVSYFGLDDPSQFQKNMEHATDSTFCPFCGARLLYEGYYYSHIGVWKCETCKAKRSPLDVWESEYPLPGLYNRYNTLAAVAVAHVLDIKQKTINKALGGFQPAFGRQEEFDVDGKKVKIFLSKNPTGFNQSLRTAMELGGKHMLFVLNDRIPDGRDVSWIWDVDFEVLMHNKHMIEERDKHVITVSGDRTYDLALRLKYGEEREKKNGRRKKVFVEPDLDKALPCALEATPLGETLYILATYSAMLEVRKLLTGKKIL